MNGKYILDGHNPVECDDVIEWGKWFETANRHVAKDEIGNVKISTVFLGLDHNYISGSYPVLFETMIFGGEHDSYQERYSTWEEAEEGHKKAVELVKSAT